MSVELNETDVRELAWVADVLDESRQGGLNVYEKHDLAELIRSKLPEPKPAQPTRPGAMVYDKNGAYYVTFGDGRWFLMGTAGSTDLLEVPWGSILEPRPHFKGYTVVS